MGRHRTKDVVDLMRQSPERRIRDIGIPDEDVCRHCDSTILDEGPWHDEDCPFYVEFTEEEENDILEEEELLQ